MKPPHPLEVEHQGSPLLGKNSSNRGRLKILGSITGQSFDMSQLKSFMCQRRDRFDEFDRESGNIQLIQAGTASWRKVTGRSPLESRIYISLVGGTERKALQV